MGSFNDVEVSKVSPGANTEKNHGRKLLITKYGEPQKILLWYLLRRIAILRGFLMGLPLGVNVRAGSLKAWEVAINSAAQFNTAPPPSQPRLGYTLIKIDL